MDIWKYSRGEWAESVFDWPDLMDFEDALQRNGYSRGAAINFPEDGDFIEVYPKLGTEGIAPCMVAVCLDASSNDFIQTDDLPSLIMLLKDLAPIVSAYETGVMSELAQKSFRIWHGHSHRLICQECDPIGYEQLQKARSARKRGKQ
ncbi:hypothetical protein [Methylohalobius crimeensis]|uniref:hypothetical protein n=1 Tax=Methylohalobius crimeensis TaxID=244365 RepID=UPI0003B468A6|nr:hypothetical protein [Methylohalobius crimeensis]